MAKRDLEPQVEASDLNGHEEGLAVLGIPLKDPPPSFQHRTRFRSEGAIYKDSGRMGAISNLGKVDTLGR